MKYLLLILTATTSLFMTTVSMATETKQPAEQALEEMVAVVNDDLITESELSNAMQSVKLQLTAQHIDIPSDKTLKKQVLDQLINKKLQLQMAKQSGVSATDDELNSAIERIASQNKVAVNELYKRLDQEGISKEKYRHDLREQITMQKLQQQQLASKITVSSQDIESFIESAKAKMANEKEFLIHDILIPVSEKPNQKELAKAEDRAADILRALRKGTKISSIVKQYKKSKVDIQDGDLGWRSSGEIPNAFTKAVAQLKKSEYSGPVKAANGYHILYMKDVRQIEVPEGQFADKKKIENMILQRKFEEAVQNWVSQLRSQAFITIT